MTLFTKLKNLWNWLKTFFVHKKSSNDSFESVDTKNDSNMMKEDPIFPPITLPNELWNTGSFK